MTNLFNKAQSVPAKKSATKKNAKEEVFTPGLKAFSAVNSLITALGTLQKTLESEIKHGPMKNFFQEKVELHKKKPDSYIGIEGNASASLELRKRSTNSKLTEDEVNQLQNAGIPVQTITDREECFIFNPKYLDNSELLEKISNALGSIEGLPDDLIQKQEAVRKQVISEETLNKLCAEPHKFKAFGSIATVMAIKAKTTETDVAKLFETVKDMLEVKDEE